MLSVYFVLSSLLYSISCQNQNQMPVFSGLGYDVFKGNPKTNIIDPGFRAPIFRVSYSTSQKTEDGVYLVPDSYSTRRTVSCSYTSTSSLYTGMTSYQKDLSVLAAVSGGYEGVSLQASFSASVGYKSRQDEMEGNTKMFSEASASCQLYMLEIQEYGTKLPLDDNFISAVNDTLNGLSTWQNFITSFGTHYISKAIMGGRTVVQYKYSRTSFQKMTSIGVDVNVAVRAKYAQWSGDVRTDTSSLSNYLNAFDKSVEDRSILYIGGKPPLTGNWIDWQASLKDSLAPISYVTNPITKLFNSNRFPWLTSSQLKNATNELTEAVKQYCGAIGCQIPGADPALPSKPTAVLYNSPSYGGWGGTWFQEKVPENPVMNVRKVIIRSGSMIDNLQFLVSDGIRSYYTQAYGGQGGTEYIYEVPEGETITQIEIYYGWRVDSLRFITNKGNKSPKYGGGGGTYQLIDLNGNLVSLFGRSGGALDRVGFTSYKVQYES